MSEEWVQVKGFEGSYAISNKGRIWSFYRDGRFLRFSFDKKTKCHKVYLSKDGIRYVFSVYRLLALHFIPNPLQKPEVNHIDGNRSNCSLDNLEWVTRSENNKHAFRIGLRRSTKGRKCKPFTDEHRKRMSISAKERCIRIGAPRTRLKELQTA